MVGGAHTRTADHVSAAEVHPADFDWWQGVSVADDGVVHGLRSNEPCTYTPGQFWKQPELPVRSWSAPSMPAAQGFRFDADALEAELGDFPFPALAAFVLFGLRWGFDTGTNVQEKQVSSSNLKSADQQPEAVLEWLQTEVERGHMAVFDEAPHEFYRSCGIGIVPKPDGADGEKRWRFISDFSRSGEGREESINAGIDAEQWRLKMLSVWDVVDLMAEFGDDARWSAIDCEWGYRQLDVHPDLYHTQVYEHLRRWYVDYRLVFGSSSSPAIYNAVMECVEFVCQQRIDVALGAGQAKVRHYLDDFIVIGRNLAVCKIATEIMLQTFKDLRIPLSHSKSQLNRSSGIYLGLALDSCRQHAAIPKKKKAETRQLLRVLCHKDTTSVPKKQMEKTVGKLTWGHNQWYQSRPLINPFLHALAAQPLAFGRVLVTDQIRETAEQWLLAIAETEARAFNVRPRVLALPSSHSCWEEDANVFCGDASGEIGFGWFNRVAVRIKPWTTEQKSSASLCTGFADLQGAVIKNSSTLQELRCLADAVRYWLSTEPAEGGVCTFFTDALNLVHLFKKGRSKQAGINQELLELGCDLRRSNRAVRVVWQSREDPLAKAADCLSRLNIDAFSQMRPKHPAIVVCGPGKA